MTRRVQLGFVSLAILSGFVLWRAGSAHDCLMIGGTARQPQSIADTFSAAQARTLERSDIGNGSVRRGVSCGRGAGRFRP
jgi:hypothetical protein